jgi:hypothetical protein
MGCKHQMGVVHPFHIFRIFVLECWSAVPLDIFSPQVIVMLKDLQSLEEIIHLGRLFREKVKE